MQRLRDSSYVQVVISRCTLAIAVGVVGAFPIALAPAPIPVPFLLPRQQPFLPSEEYIVVVRLFYGSLASTDDFELPLLLAPVGPDAP